MVKHTSGGRRRSRAAGLSERQGARAARPRGAERLTLLGAGRVPIPASPDEARLETFDNLYPRRDYVIEFDCPEFTCVCPKTGQPDFGVIRIRYVPAERCVELKSLKLYLWSYRDNGTFHETVTHQILDDLVKALDPTWLRVEGDFNVRGGLHTRVFAYHGLRPDSVPEPPT